MNCKPGDLAIIRYARGSEKGTGRNIGRICRVVSAYGVYETGEGPLFHWTIELVGSPGRTSNFHDVRIGNFPDKYLTPIQPEPALDEVREEACA